MNVRSCSHADSWYSGDKNTLFSQLSGWLASANKTFHPARAIITPHAGYRYSGSCAAYGFKQVEPTRVKRIFILGPSHHLYLEDTCALTCASEYETPFYNLKIDDTVYQALKNSGSFTYLTIKQDEAEHSLEMQLPFIAHIMQSQENQFTIVPIIVGHLTYKRQAYFGGLLSPYLCDPENLFVISSDFCHWGRRFHFQYFDKSDGEIWQSIKKLDHMGMDAIQSLKPNEFSDYLEEYNNTICGRRGIGILLYMVEAARQEGCLNWELKFLHYSQSKQCENMDDSSVSYATAALVAT